MFLSERNKSGATFTVLGFSDYPELQVPLFLIFFTIYSVTVVGNLGMIVTIKINPKLHTPMYFFLSHPSFVDFCYSSIIARKTMVNLMVEDRTISFVVCVIQVFFFCTFVVTESFLLAVMAYDLFVAICNPLLYMVAMSPRLCAMLVVGSFAWGTTYSLAFTFLLANYHFVVSTQSITSSVSSPPCFPSLALILISTSCCFLFLPPLMRSAHPSSFSCLMFLLLSPSSRCIQPVVAAKPSPLVPPA